MVNGIERPLDLLNVSKGKEILVHLKNDKQFSGTLLAFDIHVNVVFGLRVALNFYFFLFQNLYILK